jgi:hypothetical protein
MTDCQSSSEVAAAGPGLPRIPAFAATTSSLPSCATPSATSASTALESRTSA